MFGEKVLSRRINELSLGEPTKSVEYTGFVLDTASHQKLAALAPEGWQVFAHHMTVINPPNMKRRLPARWLGAEFCVRVTGVAQDSMVMTALVDLGGAPIPMKGPEYPHVTIATNPSAGGKPAMSNWKFKPKIDELNFQEITPITICGTIEEVLREERRPSALRCLIRETLLREAQSEDPVRMPLDLPVPADIRDLTKKFRAAGHELYIVGGAVRDTLLNKTPKDYDLATSAPPDEVIELLSGSPEFQTKPVGEAFGVVLVKTPDGGEYEVATFRKDIGKGRRPDAVEFTDIKSDVQRRDLTINALFYDIDTGEVVDYVGGIEDLSNGVVRTVGQPEDRFGEDKLRVLRAIRFAARLGSDLDPDTARAIKEDPILEQVSPERIRDEFLKGIETAQRVPHFLEMFEDLDLFEEVFPGLEVNAEYHQERDPIIQLALLLRDNVPTAVTQILKSVKYTNEEVKKITFLLEFQGLQETSAPLLKKRYNSSGLNPDQLSVFAEAAQAPDERHVRAFLEFASSPPPVDPRELMSQGLTGPDIGKAMEDAEYDAYRQLVGEAIKQTGQSLRAFVRTVLSERL